MLANLRALFGVVVDIVFLRRGPENMPASITLLGIVVVVYVALYSLAYSVFILPVAPETPDSWLVQIACGSLLQLAWFWVAFQLAGKPERFTQTATAIYATGMFFIPTLALLGTLMPFMKKGATGQPPPLIGLLTLLIAVWVFVIVVRIVRSAFEWAWFRTIIFVLAANLVPMIILGLVFGDSQKPI
jgi:hypothetical protein